MGSFTKITFRIPWLTGQQGGVFFYFEGASIGRPNKYIFMPKKIDLSPYFDMSIRQQEMSSFPQHPEEIFGNITMRTVPDQYSNGKSHFFLLEKLQRNKQ